MMNTLHRARLMVRRAYHEAQDAEAWNRYYVPEEAQSPLATTLCILWQRHRDLWRCLRNRHDPMALWYSDGGEDGPRGTRCSDCGECLSLGDIVDRDYQHAFHVARETEMVEFLAQQTLDLRRTAEIIPFPEQGMLVLSLDDIVGVPLTTSRPDPLRSLEPDCESRYLHGSDPAIRTVRNDNEEA